MAPINTVSSINVELLKKQVEAGKAYRAAQVATYYGNAVDDVDIDECVSLERLLLIADATGEGISVGLKNPDGSAQTKYLTWGGCRFWAPVYKAF